jgi:hypothetical protein
MLCVPLGAARAATGDEQSGRSDLGLLLQAGHETDAEDFNGLLVRGGLFVDYRSHLQNAGVAIQNTRYSQDGWDKDVAAVLGVYRDQRSDTLAGVRAEAGLASVAGHVRPVGEVTWSLRPRESTGVELIAAGDVVGTREAIERGITYGLIAASVEQQFGDRLTTIALAGWQPFTDGNSRNLLRLRFIYTLLADQGVSLQARWRQYSSSEDDVDGAYFNPEHYRNWDAGLSLRRHVRGWMVSALAGAGQERIDEQSWKSTGVAELRGEGPLANGKHLALGLVYMRAAGFSTDPDYWYGGVNVTLSMPVGR